MELLMRPFRTSRAKIIWIMGHSTTSVASLVERWHKKIRFLPSGCLDTREANQWKCCIFRMKKNLRPCSLSILLYGWHRLGPNKTMCIRVYATCASEFTRHEVMDGTAPAATLRKWPGLCFSSPNFLQNFQNTYHIESLNYQKTHA